MEKKYFDFDNIRDREDFYIALVVLAFFGWLLWQFGIDRGQGNIKEQIAKVVPMAADPVKVIEVEEVDSDGDGVADIRDNCPTVHGFAIYNGCPEKEGKVEVAAAATAGTAIVAKTANVDTDGDGVMDGSDRCPGIKGVAPTGCPPDRDGDNIFDYEDKCPSLKGTAANFGCPPDSDKDGVYDTEDKCPNQRGDRRYNGCPPPKDSDGDGVADADDKCPRLKGIAANNGCPPDSDGDGVYDPQDRCPNRAGVAANNGCPEVKLEASEQKLLETAIKNVEFKSASSLLKPGSQKILKDLGALMKKYPDYNLTINGHTDNQGEAAKNLKLSEDRARACFENLKNQGISANRMKARGFGQTQPKAKNDTPEGRKQNRRVEFILNYY